MNTTTTVLRLRGYGMLALAMVTVGSTVVASKVIATQVTPLLATAWRLALALPVLLLVWAWVRPAWPELSWRDGVLLLVQACAGSVGYTVFLIMGLRYLPASDAGVLIGTLPTVAALFAIVVLRERPHGLVLLSVGLATTGVLAVAWQGAALSSLGGSALVLLAVVSESAFILLNKRMKVALHPVLQATLMTGLGLLVCLPFVGWRMATVALPQAAWLALAFYALVPTVLGFLLWYGGSRYVSGSHAALFTAVAPVSAVLLAALVLGESVALRQWLGLGAVLAAMVLLVWSQRQR